MAARRSQLLSAITIIFLGGFFAFFLPPFHKTHAQQLSTFSIATTYPISDKNIKDGDIVSLVDGSDKLKLSKTAYDDKMYGVYVASPKIVYRAPNGSNYPIIRDGIASVNVTTLGGPIKIGDYLTSSPIAGEGQKATEISGYVLGIALQNFSDKDGAKIDYNKEKVTSGKILAILGIGPASPVQIKSAGGFFGTLKVLLTNFVYSITSTKEGISLVRFAMAAMVAVATIYINFRTFGKNVTQGIEAIGRNPLAKASIQSMIILNIALIALVSIGGIVLSLAIITI